MHTAAPPRCCCITAHQHGIAVRMQVHGRSPQVAGDEQCTRLHVTMLPQQGRSGSAHSSCCVLHQQTSRHQQLRPPSMHARAHDAPLHQAGQVFDAVQARHREQQRLGRVLQHTHRQRRLRRAVHQLLQRQQEACKAACTGMRQALEWQRLNGSMCRQELPDDAGLQTHEQHKCASKCSTSMQCAFARVLVQRTRVLPRSMRHCRASTPTRNTYGTRARTQLLAVHGGRQRSPLLQQKHHALHRACE